MAVPLPAVAMPTPSEIQLYQKAQSLGLLQKEPTYSTFMMTGQDENVKTRNEVTEVNKQNESKSSSPSNKLGLKLPVIKHPLSDRPQVSRSMRRELSGYQLFSFTSVSPRRFEETKLESLFKQEKPLVRQEYCPKHRQTDQGLEKQKDTGRKNNSKAVQLLRLPMMRSKTNLDYLMKKQKETTQVYMKQHTANTTTRQIKSEGDAINTILPRQKLAPQSDKILQKEKAPKQPEVRVIVSPKSKYDFLHRPEDYYTRKYPLVILDKEMRKKQREAFKAMGKGKNWFKEYKGGSELTRTKTEVLPVEYSIELYKGRVRPIKTVSGWIGGLQCGQKTLHDRAFMPPNTS